MRNDKLITSVMSNNRREILRIRHFLKSFFISSYLTDSGYELVVGKDISKVLQKFITSDGLIISVNGQTKSFIASKH